jgi:toxin ParE1/3/4
LARRYRLSNRARAGLFNIWSDIVVDNPQAADALVRRIMEKIEAASVHTGLGSPRPEIGKGARMLVEGNYKVVYVPEGDGIFVTTIVHSKRHPANW